MAGPFELDKLFGSQTDGKALRRACSADAYGGDHSVGRQPTISRRRQVTDSKRSRSGER